MNALVASFCGSAPRRLKMNKMLRTMDLTDLQLQRRILQENIIALRGELDSVLSHIPLEFFPEQQHNEVLATMLEMLRGMKTEDWTRPYRTCYRLV